MRHKVFAIAALCAFIALCALPALVFAQANTTQANTQANITPSRITQAIDEANLTQLRGNTHPLAQARFDQGAAPDSLPMQRMLLVLKRSPTQESALDALLDQQQDSTSANFHQWLTPQQFGQQFGPSDQDIQTITDWLQSHGFTVAGVSNGRTVIEFSGTAGQVRQAFHTEIHRYTMNGQDHWANASDPQIPAALTPVVAGINTLYNFPRRAMHHLSGTVTRSASTGQYKPANPSNSLFTLNGTCGVPGTECYGVSPYDFATIYNLLPLWQASTDGIGQTIAIVGQSDISLQDIQSFRSFFGLPNDTVNVMVEGPDPGIILEDETESDLDVEWSGAVARGATIDLVESESTEVSAGVDLAAQYAIDNNLAPVLSMSYGVCELFLGQASNQFFNQLWQQASAEGITVLVSEGDSGSAVCDRNLQTQGAAVDGLSVNGISSTPYNVAVGGTDFFDLTDPSTYWGAVNSPPVTGALPTLSALSYIPETTWNDTCTNAVFSTLGFSTNAETNCNNSQLVNAGFVQTVGGSGGLSSCTAPTGTIPSTCTGGYAKPSWQTVLTPSDSARDVPDVSLYAASGSPSGAFYIICEADLVQAGTSCDSSDPNTEFLSIGGTSASAPAFAGIMALINQATGSRQGNANYALYKLAAASGASCNSTGTLNSNCVFYDTTNGTIAMPCAIKSVDEPGPDSSTCPIKTQGDTVGVLTGYSAASGYDLATGLGSVNANNLVSAWRTFASNLKPSTTSLTINNGAAVNISHGQIVQVSIDVSGTGSTPTGSVSLIAETSSGSQQNVGSAVLQNGSATFSTTSLPGGSYPVFAQYAGDASFRSGVSASQQVSVSAEASAVQLAFQLYDPLTSRQANPNAGSATFGTPSLLRINVTSQAADACAHNTPYDLGCPTGTVTVTDNGNALDGGVYNLNSQGYAEDQIINLAPGTHQLAASYSGDNSFTASSATDTITINQAATSIALSTTSTSWSGEFLLSALLTTNSYATGTGNLPTGTVELLMDGSTVFVPPSSIESSTNTTSGAAQGTFSVDGGSNDLSPGQHTFTAVYSGDSNYAGATTSAPLTATVTSPTYTSVGVASAGQGSPSVIVTAYVHAWLGGLVITPNIPFLTGSVQFNLSSATGTSLGNAAVSNGTAQITVATSSISSGSIVFATYSGDTNYLTSTGSVTPASLKLNTAVTLTPANPSATAGIPMMFTAQLAAAPGGPTPTGTITFFTGNNADQVISNTVPLSGTQAQDSIALWSGGEPVTATYSGDSNYASSFTIVIENVAPLGTTTTLSSSNRSAHVGDTVVFSASASENQSGGPGLTNPTFFFYANGTLLGYAFGQLATFSVSNLAAGTYSITASLGGDLYHSASSANLTQTVSPIGSTTSLSSSNSTITQGSLVTLTASVARANSLAPLPTGAVQFVANGKSIAVLPISNGQAQFVTNALPGGSVNVVANYSGDSNYLPSAATLTESVSAPPGFSISASPSSVTISSPGSSATSTLTFTSQGGLTGSGVLASPTCGISASEEITCYVTSFTLPANGTATATLTFSSTAAVASVPNIRNEPFTPGANAQRMLLFGFSMSGAMLVFLLHRRQHRWRMVSGALIFAVILSGASCGGGGSNSSGGGNNPPSNPGTPAGAVSSLTVSVTINGVTQTVPNLTLTVN